MRLAFLFLLFIALPAYAEDIRVCFTPGEDCTGLVVSVHDGDTLTILVGKQQIKVRLAEIDAPELRQSFGNRSKQSLAELCFQQSAKMDVIARDRYGRSVGKVESPERMLVRTRSAPAWRGYMTITAS